MGRNSDILMPAQAATRLQCSEAEVLDQIEGGRLGAARVGDGWRLTQRDLDGLLRRGGSAGLPRARRAPRRVALLLVAGALCGAVLAWAQGAGLLADNVPRTIPYVGTVSRDGAPIDGEVDLVFTLSDGSEDNVWQEALRVEAAQGRYSVELGAQEGNPVPDWVWEAAELWLGLTIDDVELEGRQRILSTPFAVKAAMATEAGRVGAPPELLEVGAGRPYASLPEALGGAVVVAHGVAVRGCEYGFVASSGSSIIGSHLVAEGCDGAGFASQARSVLDVRFGRASNNGACGFLSFDDAYLRVGGETISEGNAFNWCPDEDASDSAALHRP